MPFSNFTGDESKDYVSEGVASSLITALGELHGLTVLSRSEAWAFRNKDWTARQLGEELGVQTLLEGDVQGKTDAISVSTRLIDVTSGETGEATSLRKSASLSPAEGWLERGVEYASRIQRPDLS